VQPISGTQPDLASNGNRKVFRCILTVLPAGPYTDSSKDLGIRPRPTTPITGILAGLWRRMRQEKEEKRKNWTGLGRKLAPLSRIKKHAIKTTQN